MPPEENVRLFMDKADQQLEKTRKWRTYFVICCLVYTGWVIHLGGNDFGRIHREYRRAKDLTTADRITVVALEELLIECRKKEAQQADPSSNAKKVGSEIAADKEDTCLSWPPAVVEAKKNEIVNRFDRARSKLILFYVFFVILFLIIPQVLVYVAVSLIVRMFTTIEIVRK
jgi:hypothetical protein